MKDKAMTITFNKIKFVKIIEKRVKGAKTGDFSFKPREDDCI